MAKVREAIGYLFSNLILFGPPGSGKGTLSQYLKTRYGYNHCSVGDLVRRKIQENSLQGKQAAASLKRGEFLEESLIQSIVKEQLIFQSTRKTPFILDGYPRTAPSALFLKTCLSELHLKGMGIVLEADDITCLERILNRTICSECSTVYNTRHIQTKQSGICDFCSSALTVRDFDDKQTAQTRLNRYRHSMPSILALCEEFIPLIRLNFQRPLSECFKQCDEAIKK